jgi:hypothetical protein
MRWTWPRLIAVLVAAFAVSATAAAAQPPVARPQPPPSIPGATAQPKPAAPKPAPPATPAATPSTSGAEAPPPASALGGIPLFPGAQFLGSYDAGRGQRFYLYGATQSFAELVAYYRTVLKDKGELVFDAPATHEFDVGRYKETDVEFQPGVTIKDYTWGGSPGYMNPKLGASPTHFPTVIQVVSPPAGSGGRAR